MNADHEVYDCVIIGSGFGGSVAAMRLTERGYRVLVLERGKRYLDEEFAHTNWIIWKYLWAPLIRCFGILQISILQGVMILHGSGVGGGSLGYANVLEVPDDKLFESPAWRHLADWKSILTPHYETAKRMLGVTTNPRLGPADEVMREVAEDLGQSASFRPTEVGVFFGKEGETAADPFFEGTGPDRTGCIHCGACMVGCRHNAKNTLVKNYLYFAEKWGAEIRSESEVVDIRPLPTSGLEENGFEIHYKSSTAWLRNPVLRVQARRVVVSAGVLGTVKLLLRCRDVTGSLPDLSPRLGDFVRTNSEALLGSVRRDDKVDYSRGLAITSIFSADKATRVEPVRFPEGSSLMRFLAVPLAVRGRSFLGRLFNSVGEILAHPKNFYYSHLQTGWARRTIIFLVMQTVDNRLRLRLGRSLHTFFRRGLVSELDAENPAPTRIPIGHQVTHAFAEKTNGVPLGSIGENILNMPTTAHILGGCPMGENEQEGVVDPYCQVHGYPGLYVVDGSVVPANPGVNPSLTITAIAEYALSHFHE
jgi:cholesterol oxidase